MDQQYMERSFLWHVLVTPRNQADIARDHRVATRVSTVACTRAKAREVGALGREEDMRPDVIASN